jgi:hypothetical protein
MTQDSRSRRGLSDSGFALGLTHGLPDSIALARWRGALARCETRWYVLKPGTPTGPWWGARRCRRLLVFGPLQCPPPQLPLPHR